MLMHMYWIIIRLLLCILLYLLLNWTTSIKESWMHDICAYIFLAHCSNVPQCTYTCSMQCYCGIANLLQDVPDMMSQTQSCLIRYRMYWHCHFPRLPPTVSAVSFPFSPPPPPSCCNHLCPLKIGLMWELCNTIPSGKLEMSLNSLE